MNGLLVAIMIAGAPAIGLNSLFAGLGGRAVVLRRQRPGIFAALAVALGLAAAAPSILVGKRFGELPACVALLAFSVLAGKIAGLCCSNLVKVRLRPPEPEETTSPGSR